MPKHWFNLVLSNLLIAALLGTLMRFAYIQELPFVKYKNLLHAHSHVAMLGWLYLGIYGLLIQLFLRDENSASFRRLFWVSQLSVWGMLISFPFQGYGPISIAFSSLHMICSSIFCYWVWISLRTDYRFSSQLLRTALFFLILSTIGVWMIAPLTALGLRHSIWYHLSVQFYLHFQFNGWFILVAMALVFRWFEQINISFPTRSLLVLQALFVLSSIFTFALAIAWSEPHPMVFTLNSLGVCLQLVALFMLAKLLYPHRKNIKSQLNPINFNLWRISFISLLFKALIQAAVVLPAVAKMAYTIRNYIIGFIHLVMLGVLSFFILGLYFQLQGTSPQQHFRLGLWVFGIGVVCVEFLLFLQGTLIWAEWGFLPNYYLILFLGSALMPIGILWMLFSKK